MKDHNIANTEEENTGYPRPVAISSTSSLDSFATSYTQANIDNSSSRSNAAVIKEESSSAIKQDNQQEIVQRQPPCPTSNNSTVVSSRPSLIPFPLSSSPSATPVPIMPSHPSFATSASNSNKVPASNNTVAEFLYQLTKMLTDDNREIIEWNNGKIEVHNPHRLASEVLHQYFRHSKFASFQRQLNYFGFRKLAGKGKMAPCSYINEAATSDLRSILLIKVRKIA